jgi:hypothetical protein
MAEAHVRKAGPFAAVANVVELWPRPGDDGLPWNPEIGHVRTHLQVTDMAGGTAVVYVRGPGDVWVEVQPGLVLGEGDVVVITDPWPGFRVEFSGVGNVFAAGYSKVWR